MRRGISRAGASTVANRVVEGRHSVVHAREVGIRMDRMAEHGTRRAALMAGFCAAKASGLPIGLRKTTSNLFRRRERGARRKLDVRPFDRVLRIDPERRIADVEGMTTYETLVDETLRFGLLPAVVPQLKT